MPQFFKKNIIKFKLLSHRQKGMTYVELIVVLSIFAIISSVSIFEYKTFQDKLDIKNLSADIALRIVKAQKDSVSGYFPPSIVPSIPEWKPSYGISFNLIPSTNTGNNIFYSFVDLNQLKSFDYGTYACPIGECLEKINITKGNIISDITIYYNEPVLPSSAVLDNIDITFTRPNSGASFYSTNTLNGGVKYVKISVSNQSGSVVSVINIYPSGRIEVN